MAVVANVAINVDAKGAVSQLNRVDAAAGELNRTFFSLQNAVAALGLGVAIKSIADIGQRSEQTKNQIKALTAQYGELGAATASVDRIQKVLGVSTLDAREGFAQLYAALRGTGVTVQQLEVLFVGLTNAARLSGAGAAEAQGALLQLKQAFASGSLSGDELRSVLEAMPAFTQQLAKETDRLGLTTNATSADIKKLGSEGKITSDILFRAAQTLAVSNAPNITTAEKLGIAFTNLREKLAETFGPVIIDAVRVFTASVTALGNWFKANQTPIQQVSSVLLNLLKALAPGAAAVMIVVKAYQAWTIASKALAATQAFLVALTGPKGVALVAGAAIAAGVAYTGLNKILQGTESELKKQKTEAQQAQEAFRKTALNVQPIPGKIKEAAAATTELGIAAQATLDFYKQQKITIDGQLASLERGAALTTKRYEALLAINGLEQQQLERSYQQAKTARERFDIAVQILNKQLEAAKIEYSQAIEAIKLEEQKLDLRLQLEQTKLREIDAEADLQKLKASDIKNADERLKKEQEIDQKRKDAIASQQGVITELEKQIPAQKQIAEYEEQVAALKFESNKLTARGAFEQKLTSQEIGVSKERAAQLSGQIADNVNITRNLKNEYSGVVMQIERAVTAQQRLNQARQGGNPAPAPAQSGYAQGGYVSKPTRAIIGEGGESEYVIPASKMSAAMLRYASGQRGDSVIPGGNTAGAPGGDMGSTSINPMINVTTGPVMNMNGSNYVSQRDFVAGMQAASRRGAEMALSALRGNGGVRRSVGAR